MLLRTASRFAVQRTHSRSRLSFPRTLTSRFRRSFSSSSSSSSSSTAGGGRRGLDLVSGVRYALLGAGLSLVANVTLRPSIRESLYQYQVSYTQEYQEWKKSLPEGTVVPVIEGVLPLRAMSFLWGAVNQIDLPVWLRAPVYKLWTYMFDCNLSEMRYPLEHYPNLASFFTRPLKDGVRPMQSAVMVSPIDGRVGAFGRTSAHGEIDQVKGQSFKVEELLGEVPMRLKNPHNDLYYCVLYLAPGDYHRFHAPADVSFARRDHREGQLLPVAPSFIKEFVGVFPRNERVVLNGEWKHGWFSYVPVGAYNVGSIRLNFDGDLATNQWFRPAAYQNKIAYAGDKGQKLAKGDEIGRFQLGSTVVLVFEAPKNAKFPLQTGQRIKVGQNLFVLDE